jgi:hypothetical protein
MSRILKLSLAAIVLIGAPASVSAQQYPTRPITLVVPLPPGGTNDIMARIIGERMTKLLGQQIVVENRAAGGSGTVATRGVARATPDGYTIVLSYTSTFATGPSMYKNAGYDPAQGLRADRPDRGVAKPRARQQGCAGQDHSRADRLHQEDGRAVPIWFARHRHVQSSGSGTVCAHR